MWSISVVNPNDNAIGDNNSYQAPDNFKQESSVKIYHNGQLIMPSAYTLYKQGKIVFNSNVNYANNDLLIEYPKYIKTFDDFSNDFSGNILGLSVYEQGGSNMYDIVADPSGGDYNVLKISKNSSVTENLIRCQLYRNVNYTDYTKEVKVYVPQELIDALISYQDVVHWFALSSDWCPYGPSTGSTQNLYSGSSNAVQIYKANAEDTELHYQIMCRKRTFVNGVENYTTLASNISDFVVLGNEWITLKLNVKVGNPGVFQLTVTDSNGEHVLNPMASGNDVAYVGVPDPENEQDLYGSSLIDDVPYRSIKQTMFAKLYTSADIANHIINENGEVAIYFKDYKEYDCVNVNAF